MDCNQDNRALGRGVDREATLKVGGERRRIDLVFGTGMVIVGLIGCCAPEFVELPGMVAELGGALLAVVGILTVTFRSGAVIDAEANTLTLWCGFPVSIYRERHQILPTAVRLTHRVSHSEAASWSRFPISLLSDNDEVVVVSRNTPMAAWTLAQDIARFLNVQLVDDSEEGVYEFLPSVTALRERWRRWKNRGRHPQNRPGVTTRG